MTIPGRRADRARRGLVAGSPAAGGARALLDRQLHLPRAASGPRRRRRRAPRTGRSRGATPTGATPSSTIEVAIDAQLEPRADEHGRPDREGGARLLRRRVTDDQAGVRVARVLTTVESVRARFTALQQPLAFFDGPGGTQVPDSVIDAIATYLREANANLGGAFVDLAGDRRRSSTAAHADRRGAPRRDGRRGGLRREHDDAELRAHARGLARVAGRRRDRLHAARPRRQHLAVARARARPRPRPSASADVDDECRLDLDTARVAAVRAHARRRVPVGLERGRHADARRRDRRSSRTTPARSRGSTPCTTAPHGPIDVAGGRRRRRCSARRTSSTGRTSGSRSAGASCSSRGARTRCGPPPISPSATATRPGRSRTSCSPASSPRSTTCGEIGWDFILEHERALGEQFLDGLPDAWTLHGVADDGRPRADVRDHARRPSRRRRPRSASASAASRSGTATTTPSRSCGASAWTTARSASASSTTTPRTRCGACSPSWLRSRRTDRPSRSPRRAASPASGGSGRGRRRAHRPLRASAGGSGRCPPPDAASGSVSRRPRAPRAR